MEVWKMISGALVFCVSLVLFCLSLVIKLWELEEAVQLVRLVWDVVVGSVHLQLSSRSLATIVVYLFRRALSLYNIAQLQFHELNDRCTEAKLFGAGLVVVAVAVDLESGLLVGSILATGSLLLVSTFICARYQLEELFFYPIIMLSLYNHYSLLVAVMLTIQSYLGLPSEAYIMLMAVWIRLVQKGEFRGLSWSYNVVWVAMIAFLIYVPWKILFALAMAIHLDSWLSFQTASNLVCACVSILSVVYIHPRSAPISKARRVENVTS